MITDKKKDILRCLKQFFSSIIIFFSISVCSVDSRIWQNIGPEGGEIDSLIISPGKPDIVYALVSGILFQSSNGGLLWEEVKREGEHRFSSTQLLVDSLNPQILFALNQSTFKLQRSTDGGKHWQTVDQDLDPLGFFELNNPVTQPLRAVVSKENGNEQSIVVSHNGGEHWTFSEQNISQINNQIVRIVGIDPKKSDILYGSIISDLRYQQLYKSIDAGATWSKILQSESKRDVDAFGLETGGLYIHPTNTQILFNRFIDNTYSGTFAWSSSKDGGLSWEPLGTIGDDITPFQLILDPNNFHSVFALAIANKSGPGFDEDEVLIAKSIDSGSNWEIFPTGTYQTSHLTGERYRRTAINPQNNQQILLGYSKNILRSENGGLDWQSSIEGINFLEGGLFVAPDNANIMFFISIFGNEFYKSLDGGKQWQKMSFKTILNNGKCSSFIFNPVNHQDLLCLTTQEVYRSLDAGENWSLFKQFGEFGEIIYVNDGKTFYFNNFDSNRVIKSTENDGVWSDFHFEWNQAGFTHVSSILINPRDSKIIYIVASVNGSTSVYKSYNGGVNWVRQIGAIHDAGRLLMHPDYPDRLIFIDGTTVSLTLDGGIGWTPLPDLSLNIENIPAFIPSVVFNPRNLDGLFLSTNSSVYETKDLGKSWNLMDSGLSNSFTPKLQIVSGDVYVSTSPGIYKLTHAAYSFEDKDCLFNWAEQQYSLLFSPAFAKSQLYEDYNYRYYNNTNTYLGFFQDKKVHLLQAKVSNDIKDVGYIEYYQHLSGCGNN